MLETPLKDFAVRRKGTIRREQYMCDTKGSRGPHQNFETYASCVLNQAYTLHSAPDALNQTYALHSEPDALKPRPCIQKRSLVLDLNPRPQTPDPNPTNPRPLTLVPKPLTLDPNPYPYALNPRR